MLLTGQERTGQSQAEWISGREFGLEREDGLLKGIGGRREEERERGKACL